MSSRPGSLCTVTIPCCVPVDARVEYLRLTYYLPIIRFHNGFCTSKQVLLGYQLGNAAGGMVSALMDHHADSVRKAGEKAGDAEYCES